MSTRLLAAGMGIAMLAMAASSQQPTDANPGHSPDVFLDNHRPLINKKGKAPTTRNVTGKLVDEGGQPLDGALVTLTDRKTSQKTTVVTKKDGRYNFDDLSFTIDYELQARYKDLLSEPRKLSQYDRRVKVVSDLQVAQPPKPPTATTEAKKEGPPEN